LVGDYSALAMGLLLEKGELGRPGKLGVIKAPGAAPRLTAE